MTTQTEAPRETPWGAPQQTIAIAPGVWKFCTASHGGYYLSPARRAAMPARWRALATWAGEGWYEEDCDWAIVVAAFPQLFTPAQRQCARRVLRLDHAPHR